jgi:hypothetical protein
MAAPKGNNYWEFRSKDGTEPKYTTETLWAKAVEYFQWVKENPLWESVLVAKGIVINKGKKNEKTIYSTALPKMRAMTQKAFQIFADISHTTWDNYCAKDDYVAITTRIGDIIYSQKFEGAAATLLNPNLIARELGLKEYTDNTNKQTIEFVNVSKQFKDKE